MYMFMPELACGGGRDMFMFMPAGQPNAWWLPAGPMLQLVLLMCPGGLLKLMLLLLLPMFMPKLLPS